MRAGVEIKKEATNDFAVFGNFKQTRISVPALELFDLAQFNAVQLLYYAKHALDHGVDREIGTQYFLRNGIAVLQQLFAVVA